MKKHLFSWLIALVFTLPAISQELFRGVEAQKKIPEASIIRFNANQIFPSFIYFQQNKRIRYNNFKSWIKSTLKLPSGYDFKFDESNTDRLGFEHHRFTQFYNGNPVKGGSYIVHTKNNIVHSVNGYILNMKNVGTSSSITKETAINAALNHVNATVYAWDAHKDADGDDDHANHNHAADAGYPKPTLVIVPKDLKFEKPDFRLAYVMDIFAFEPNYRAYVYVDAQTGAVIAEENRICFIDVPGTAVTKYSGTKTITVDQVSTTNYRLYETGRGGGIHTQDMNTSTNYSSAVDFTDADNNWNNVNADQDEVATDAHLGAEMSYDFFFSNFGRNSYDNNGATINSYVHYDFDYPNAFWNGSSLTYGDGSSSSLLNSPLTTIDICGHEFSHGVTEHTAALVYAKESGALNESFSDIFGVAIDYHSDSLLANWRMGEQCTSTGLGIRNMANPNEFGDPDTYGGLNWVSQICTPDPFNDYCGVHTNSGVQNFWFYLLVEGGSGTNDLSNNYSVSGIGMQDAVAIAYRSLSVYLTASSDYNDAYYYSIIAATDLFGGCSNQVAQVVNAWYAVGIGAPASNGTDFSADKTMFCATPATVQFLNTTFGVQSSLWDFGDGTTDTTTSPVHIYNQAGQYTVSLLTTGCNGMVDSMTKTNFIAIDTSIGICDTTYMPTSGSLLATACSGILVDDGGPFGYHSDNVNGTVTIQPPSAAGIQINFLALSLESCCDQVSIYDGPTISSPFLGSYTGSSIPSTITSSGGAITIQFTTDGSVTYPGFIIEWTTTGGSTQPISAFTSPNGGVLPYNFGLQFTNNSMNSGSWLWDFGDGTTSTDQNPIHAYTTSGSFSVSLTATNCVGSHTSTSTVSVGAAPTLTVTPDSLNVTLFTGDTTTQFVNIANTGLGLGYYSADANNNPYVLSSTQTYQTVGATTQHTFSNLPQSLDSMQVRVTINGDFYSTNEYAELWVEGTFIKQLEDGYNYYFDVTDSVTLFNGQLAGWLSDNTLNISIVNSASVYAYTGGNGNYHKVEISVNGKDWIALPTGAESGTITSNNATQIPVHFDALGMLGGSYYTDLILNTNDSLQAQHTIPVALTVIGVPVIGLSPTHHDFGGVFLGYSKTDSVTIHNHGTDQLIISSVSNSLSEYNVGLNSITLPPFSSVTAAITFTPSGLGTFTDTIAILNNDNDTILTLTGFGQHPPSLTVTPDSLDVVVVQNSTETESIYLNNTGQGPLSYNVGIGEEIVTIFSDDFEAGNYNNFTAGTGSYFYQINSPGATGSNHLSILGGSFNNFDGLTKNFNNVTPQAISFHVKSGSTTLDDAFFTITNGSTWNQLANFYARGDGQMGVFSGSTPLASITYSANQWYFVEIKNINYTNGTYDFYIDGQLLGTSLFFNGSLTSITDIYMYNYGFSSGSYDDIFVGENYGLATWMTPNPATGSVANNTLDSVQVTFNAAGKATGVYYSSVTVNSNDPIIPNVEIPVKMSVIAPTVADFYTGNTITCDGIVGFSDLSLNVPASWQWDFGDGSTSTLQNPTHTYTTSGLYDVKLTSCNLLGCDSITKSNYVYVDLANASCNNTIPTSGTVIETACSGTIYDDGGSTGNYSTNVYTILTIQPPNATSVTINFPVFDLYTYDDVLIYDGPNTSSNYMGSWSGTNTPPPFTSSTGAVTIVFYTYSGGGGNYPGFELQWSGTGGFLNPVASFTASNTNPALNDPVQFTNTSWNYGSLYWDFGDGNISNQDNPTHNYTLPGTYTVTLNANNCVGSHLSTQNITVQDAPTLTITPDSLNVTLLGGDTTTQFITITNTGLGQGSYNVNNQGNSYDSTSLANFVNSGASTSHSFYNLPQQVDSLKVRVTVSGDFDSNTEYAELWIEGNYIQQIEDYNLYYTDVTDSITFDNAQLGTWLNDNVLDITIVNTFGVDVFNTLNNHHIVEVSVNGSEWMAIPSSSGTVSVNASAQMPVFFDARNVNGGIYTSEVVVTTNDLNLPSKVIPTKLTVIGIPEIELSANHVDFGDVFINHTAVDSVLVKNVGSDQLVISSITNSQSTFTVTPSSMTLAPDDSAIIMISYSPTALGAASDNIIVLNNDADTVITVVANAVQPPLVSVTPSSFNITLQSGDSTNRDLMISNLGLGDLNFNAVTNGLSGLDYYENFESGTMNSLTISPSTNSTFSMNSSTPSDGQFSLDINGASGFYNGASRTLSSPSSTIDYVSFKVKTNSSSAANAYFVLGESTNFVDGIIFFYMYNNTMGVYSSATHSYFVPCNANQWYHVEMKNIDFNTQTFDYYLDGLLIQANIPFRQYAASVDKLELFNLHTATSSYDEIKIGQEGSAGWLTVEANGGTLSSNQTDTVDVKFNATGLGIGTYNSTVFVNTNDPDTPQVLVPVILQVIDVPNTSFSTDNTYSCDGLVDFVDETLNGPSSWVWDFGDGNSSTVQNPVHQYLNSGSYDVKLVTCNNVGCDSLTSYQYVTVDLTSTTCDTTYMPINGTTITKNSCSGIFYDSGGPYGNYSNNSNGTVVIQPIAAQNVTLTFNQFSLESGYDYMRIYDGPDALSPLLATLSGSNLPTPITSTGGVITIVFTTDGSAVYSGWDITWQCMQNAPTANYSYTGGGCDNAIQFANNTVAADTYLWDFGDGTTSTLVNPSHTYTSAGNYTVNLTSTNSSSNLSDQFMSNVVVHDVPDANFGYPTGIIPANTPVVFSDSSYNPNTITWLWDFGNGTTSTAQNPTIVFASNGVYQVSLTITDINGCTSTITKAVTIDFGVSTSGLNLENSLAVFPNPTSGQINLNYQFVGQKNIKAEIMNSLGQVVWTTTSETVSESWLTTVDLSTFAQGVYLVRINELDKGIVKQTVVKRIILQK